jgi:hypothetical protein
MARPGSLKADDEEALLLTGGFGLEEPEAHWRKE